LRTQVGHLPRSEKGQEETSHTDNVGRLRETTLRRSPLRYASDWRQDIDTAPAALRMTSSTTSGFDNMGTCEDATSVVVAFMRFETKRCRSGGTVWSWVARTYQLGLAFHAVPSTFWLKRSAPAPPASHTPAFVPPRADLPR